ncbi:hypothetical protein ABMA57_09780 [Saccharospirillum sp. HFRX-1]|uniref:hypothetical protein n=1 Tax=unclassified Saccharospirillum TaxID=2633430 RepID=UPI00371B96AA
MKGIHRCLLMASTLLVAAPAWSFNFFGLFGSDDSELERLLASAPADTAWFTAGHSDIDSYSFMQGEPYSANQPPMTELYELTDNSPGLAVLLRMYEDFIAQLDSTNTNLQAYYGIEAGDYYAFYLDGLMPVVRMTVSDPEAFMQRWNDAAAETGKAAKTRQIAGLDVQQWRLTAVQDNNQMNLALSLDDGIATLTVINEFDNDDRLAQRFGRAAVSESLVDSETWKALGDEYDFDTLMRGYFSITEVAKAVLQPHTSLMGQDLQALIPSEMAELNATVSANCADEWQGLAQSVPRLVYGIEDLDVSADSIMQSLRFILEMNNRAVTTELAKLPGSLPAYSNDASDKIFALAAGIDLNALSPVITALWTEFSNASFSCPQLVEMQTALRNSLNPSFAGMINGVLPGFKGLGVAAFNLEPNAQSPTGLSGSALISASADDPAILANTLRASAAAFYPIPQIPSNGDPVALPMPYWPEPIYLAIKGSHLVAYTGEAAAQAADELSNEPLNRDGTFGGAFNMARFGEAMIDGMPYFNLPTRGECEATYLSMLTFSELPVEYTYRETYTERGWEAVLNATIGRPDSAGNQIEPGQYQTSVLSSDCQWYPDGTETFTAEGAGRYVQKDDQQQCELYTLDYQWRQEGNQLFQDSQSAQSRDSCSQSLAAVEAESYQCTVLGMSEDGFYCLYDAGLDSEMLMHYRR